MKKYLIGVSIVMLFIATFGFIGPVLISSTATDGVLLGMGVIIVIIPVFYFLIKILFKNGVKNEK